MEPVSSSPPHTPDPGWAAPFFSGRNVLVVGGTSGIGAAIAAGFAAAGASVLATGASADEVEAATVSGVQCVDFRSLDVRDSDAVVKLVTAFDTLDTVVNCAGIIRRQDEHDPEVFAQVIDINLTGSMRICSAARPLLARSSQGAIVNIASVLSFQGGGLVPGYSASKGGIVQMTKSLAIAYAAENIRVNAVAPGWVTTPLTTALQEDRTRSEVILSRTPMKRWGKPDDIVGGVLFLASPAAGFVTGVTLPIDGGYLTS